jgi:hypothetical protein
MSHLGEKPCQPKTLLTLPAFSKAPASGYSEEDCCLTTRREVDSKQTSLHLAFPSNEGCRFMF